MRLDQLRMIEPLLEPFFHLERRYYWSILPTATPYARNALFAGLYPLDIAEGYPAVVDRRGRPRGQPQRPRGRAAGRAAQAARQPGRRQQPVLQGLRRPRHRPPAPQPGLAWATRGWWPAVYNFLDIMAHGRSQNRILKELAPDEAAFRTLMRSWFEHSNLYDV